MSGHGGLERSTYRNSILMIYLPDVNVWIALAADKHVHDAAARSWFAEIRDGQLLFCRITQLAFLRLLTNRHVMQEEIMSPSEAWGAYRSLRLDQRIGYSREPSTLTEHWNGLANDKASSQNLWREGLACVVLNSRS